MKKKILSIILLIVCLLTSCGQKVSDEKVEPVAVEEATEISEEVPASEPAVYGNTYGNMEQNGRFIQTENGELYYDPFLGATVMLTKEGVLNIECDFGLQCMNIIGDVLYGIGANGDNAGKLIGKQLGAEAVEVLVDESITELMAIDDTLYFCDQQNRFLHAYDTKSKEDKIILREVIYFPVIIDDMLYCQLDSQKESMWAINLSSGERKLLELGRVYFIQPYENRLYYNCINEGSTEVEICSVNMDGTDKQTISLKDMAPEAGIVSATTFVINEDKLYFLAVCEETAYLMALNLSTNQIEEEKWDVFLNSRTEFIEYCHLEPEQYNDLNNISIQNNRVYFCLDLTLGGQEAEVPFFLDTEKDEYIIAELYAEDILAAEYKALTDTIDAEIAKAVEKVQKDAQPTMSTEEMARAAFDISNEYRASVGSPALIWDDNIASVCALRANELAVSYSHTRPNGSGCDTAMTESGIYFMAFGENIAYGQTSSRQAMNDWYSSEGHRRNMLDADFTYSAVGCIYSGGRYYWVQLFAAY